MNHTKRSVDYGRGMASAHCGICKHYLGKGRCAMVVGVVRPDGWCKLFSKKEK